MENWHGNRRSFGSTYFLSAVVSQALALMGRGTDRLHSRITLAAHVFASRARWARLGTIISFPARALSRAKP